MDVFLENLPLLAGFDTRSNFKHNNNRFDFWVVLLDWLLNQRLRTRMYDLLLTWREWMHFCLSKGDEHEMQTSSPGSDLGSPIPLPKKIKVTQSAPLELFKFAVYVHDLNRKEIPFKCTNVFSMNFIWHLYQYYRINIYSFRDQGLAGVCTRLAIVSWPLVPGNIFFLWYLHSRAKFIALRLRHPK